MRCHLVACVVLLFALIGQSRGASDPAFRPVLIWNEEALAAVRADRARPTVQARNLFHVSAAMYDAWAAYSPHDEGYLFREKVPQPVDARQQNEAISHAAFNLLRWRYGRSPGSVHTLTAIKGRMKLLGLDPSEADRDPNSPAAWGRRVAQAYIALAETDGAHELRNYLEAPRHTPINSPLNPLVPGVRVSDPDRWQPLIVDGATQRFLTPHWQGASPFALTPTLDERFDLSLRPPLIARGEVEQLRDELVEVIRLTALADASLLNELDVSPGRVGNFALGSDHGPGHPVNPATDAPYAPNMVREGDYYRAIAAYWADGPGSDTPPGHWNAIARHICLHPATSRRVGGLGEPVSPTEWDTKLFFTLNAALHDAAIAAWDMKLRFDTARPITQIRWMGSNGQCSDPHAAAFSPMGLPLIDGLIELVTEKTSGPGLQHEHLQPHVGKVAVRGWLGPPRPANQLAGVGWMLADRWMPFQAWDFVTPAFPGYVSGHSTFSRAAAEVLAAFTGDAYFPGGIMEVVVVADVGLQIERGPTRDVRLQWAKYFDAADQSGFSRRAGGIHIRADDHDGRRIGAAIGRRTWERARELFR